MRVDAAKLKTASALLAVLLLAIVPLSAQRTHLAANAGISLAFFRGPENLVHRKNEQLAYRAGISIAFDLSRRFSIQTGMEFWNKSFEGSLSSYGMLTVITPVHLRVQHLALPLILRYHLGDHVFLGAGAYYAPKVRGRLTLFRDESDRLERGEAGTIAGVGTAFRLFGRDHILEIQWRQALTPVFSIGAEKFYFSTLSILYGMRI